MVDKAEREELTRRKLTGVDALCERNTNCERVILEKGGRQTESGLNRTEAQVLLTSSLTKLLELVLKQKRDMPEHEISQ